MSDPAAPTPATPAAPSAPPVAQPVTPPHTPAAGAPVTNVTVNLPPDLLRMAGLTGAPPAPAVQPPAPTSPAQPAAAPAAPAAPAPPAPPAPPAAPAPETAKPPADDAAAKLEAQLAELRAQLSATRDQHNATLVRAVVDRVSLTGGAISADVVLKLIGDELDVAADGRVIAKGDPRVTGEQHVARFLAANTYLLKPQVSGGGAGAPAVVTPPAGPPAVKLDMGSNEGATKLARSIAEQRGYLRPTPSAS